MVCLITYDSLSITNVQQIGIGLFDCQEPTETLRNLVPVHSTAALNQTEEKNTGKEQHETDQLIVDLLQRNQPGESTKAKRKPIIEVVPE